MLLRPAFTALVMAIVFASVGEAPAAEPRTGRVNPQVSDGIGAILESTSSGVRLKSTAGTDTFCLYGGPGSMQGKFQSTTVIPLTPAQLAAEGFTEIDITDQPTLWQRHTFNAANLNNNGPGNHAMWAGQTAAQQPGWTSAPGYGNSWNALISFEGTMANPAVGQTVGLDFYFNYDTEPTYDFFTVQYDSAGLDIVLYSADGSNKNGSNVFVSPGVQYSLQSTGSIVYAGNDYADGNATVAIHMYARSDGAWSDEDGLWPTDGGHTQVDDITVTWNDGNKTAQVDFEDFEDGGPYLWNPEKAPFAGYFGKIFPRMTDTDPCAENITPVYGFMDDGTGPTNPSYVGTGTGGTTSVNWSYGVLGGWVVNYNGGISLGNLDLDNSLRSPEIDWDLPGTADDGSDVAGARLRFDVWRHLPLNNLIFWTWSVRGRDGTSGVWGPWGNRGFVYYGGSPTWVNFEASVGDLLPNNRDKVQVQLHVLDLDGILFEYPGTDATPSPVYDNLTFLKHKIAGPSIVARTIDLFQDSFTQTGNTDASTIAARDAMDVRLDMARDVSTGLLNIPGDSIIVDVTSVIPGNTIDVVDIKLKWQLRPNPSFEAPIRGNLLGFPGVVALPNGNYAGEVVAQQSTTAAGAPVANRYFFDLPDQDFFYPGDVLHYYIEATDSGGLTTTLPSDLTEFNIPGPGGSKTEGKAGDECVLFVFYSMYKISPFRVEAKPSIWVAFISPEPGEGPGEKKATYIQPEILVVNDTGSQHSTQVFYQAMQQAGLGDYANIDIYRVQGPSSGVSNGIGSAGAHGATASQLSGYSCLIYLGEDQASFLLSDGSDSGQNDKGDDLGTMTAWHGQDADRYVAYFADNIATALASTGTGTGSAAGDTYRTAVMGVAYNDNDVRDEIGGLTAPLVTPVAAGFAEDFIAFGGCPLINQFDSIDPTGGSVASHTFVPGSGGSARTAGVIWDRLEGANNRRKVDITFPYGFGYVWDAGTPNPGGVSDRTVLLEEIVATFGSHSPEVSPTDAPPDAGRLVVGKAFPNPFNPSTRVQLHASREGHVRVEIYNLRGERIATLLNGTLSAGPAELEWNGEDLRGNRVASGIYLVRAEGFGDVALQKVVLLK